MNVSALNTLEISFFDAPIALNIPISFVLSNTEMYVIIPIIIDDTTSDMLTNAINAQLTASIMFVIELIIAPTKSVYVIVFSSFPSSLCFLLQSSIAFAISSLLSKVFGYINIDAGLSKSIAPNVFRLFS